MWAFCDFHIPVINNITVPQNKQNDKPATDSSDDVCHYTNTGGANWSSVENAGS